MIKQAHLTQPELLRVIRKEIARLGSQRLFARAAGVSDAYISDLLRGRRNCGPSLLQHLQYRVEVRYVRVER